MSLERDREFSAYLLCKNLSGPCVGDLHRYCGRKIELFPLVGIFTLFVSAVDDRGYPAEIGKLTYPKLASVILGGNAVSGHCERILIYCDQPGIFENIKRNGIEMIRICADKKGSGDDTPNRKIRAVFDIGHSGTHPIVLFMHSDDEHIGVVEAAEVRIRSGFGDESVNDVENSEASGVLGGEAVADILSDAPE